jgi:hypothetical protein
MRASFSVSTLIGVIALAGASSAVQAGGHYPVGGNFVLSCQNGADYALHSGPVTLSGDVVTGHLHLSPRKRVQVRLIPMGVGYRYAGRGVWFDGVRDRALLYLSKRHPIPCTVGQA